MDSNSEKQAIISKKRELRREFHKILKQVGGVYTLKSLREWVPSRPQDSIVHGTRICVKEYLEILDAARSDYMADLQVKASMRGVPISL